MIVDAYQHMLTGEIKFCEEGGKIPHDIIDYSTDMKSYWEKLGEFVLQEWREYDGE